MLLTNCILYDFLTIFVAILTIATVYLKWTFTYWQRKGVQTLPPSLPLGNAAPLLKKQLTFGELFREQYNYFKRNNLPYGGSYFFTRKFFVPIDPMLIKHIMLVDFQYFMNHGNYSNEKADPLTGHLFALKDAKWKRLREKLTPTFTSGKMKMMFPTMVACSDQLDKVLQRYASENQAVDIKEILASFTTDIIASCAFGIDSNCMENPDTEFRKYGRIMFELNFKQLVKVFLQFAIPHNILSYFNFKTTKQPVEDFVIDLVTKTVKYREKNRIYRKDFMHMLIQLKNIGKIIDDERIMDGKVGEIGLTMHEVAAQAFIFYAGGFETSSTTMTFALYELALNPDIQTKVREEILSVLKKYNDEITYEGVMEMKYLDRVLSETLRKYPPFGTLVRSCNKDYRVPNTDLIIKKDNFVAIPVSGLHYDHEYYPNPEKFDPERFTEENKAKRPTFTYLPFGEGPRLCIGLRFGLMQSKIGLITLLKRYKISINRKTTVPIQIDKSSFVPSAKDNIYLDVKMT